MKNNRLNRDLGDTLDYYRDDMSREAVGSLFSGIDEIMPEDSDGEASYNDTGGIVVGYNDEPDRLRREPEYREYREPTVPEHNPEMDRALDRASEMASRGYHDSIVPEPPREGPRPESPREGPRPEERPRAERAHSRVFEDEGYDMSMYRRSKDLLDDEEYEEIMRPRRRRSINPEPAVIRRAEPEEPPRKRPVRPERPERPQATRSETPRGAVRGMNLRPYVAGVFFVLMLALALLLFRVNSLGKRLEEAELKQDELNNTIGQYSTMQLQRDALQAELDALKAEIEASDTQPVGEGEETTVGTSASETALPTKYVVATGDNLSKISQKFYGNPNQYNKIKEANGLTSDVVMVGQTLTIPE